MTERIVDLGLELTNGRTRFRFTALPLKIREATGSPVRAIAILED